MCVCRPWFDRNPNRKLKFRFPNTHAKVTASTMVDFQHQLETAIETCKKVCVASDGLLEFPGMHIHVTNCGKQRFLCTTFLPSFKRFICLWLDKIFVNELQFALKLKKQQAALGSKFADLKKENQSGCSVSWSATNLTT